MTDLDTFLKALAQPVDGFSAQFRAVRDNHSETWQTLYCRPGVTVDGRVVEDEALLRLGWDDKQRAYTQVGRHMRATLDAGFAKAAELLMMDETETKVIVPVFGAALADKKLATAFALQCKKQPESVHKQIIFEVVGAGGETAMAWLDKVAIVLHLFCLAYTARVTPKVASLVFHATCNYAGVSLDLAEKPWPPEKVSPFLKDFVGKCDASRLKAYVHGVGTPPLAKSVLASGARYMDGSGVTG